MRLISISLIVPAFLLVACVSSKTSNPVPKSPALPPPPFNGPNTPEAPKPDDFTQNDILVGGYAPADIEDEASTKAKEMVIDEIYKRFPTRALVDKVDMEIQVVAGLNYRFQIEMTGNQANRDVFTGVVYRDLDDNYKLTSLDRLTR